MWTDVKLGPWLGSEIWKLSNYGSEKGTALPQIISDMYKEAYYISLSPFIFCFYIEEELEYLQFLQFNFFENKFKL